MVINLKILFAALRFHQWSKNILIFVPFFAAHRYNELDSFISLCLAFFAFSLAASANYVLNDLIDLESDKTHPTKKNRPLASGKLKVKNAIILMISLITIALIIASSLPLIFLQLLLLYLFIAILYSLFLKKEIIIDIVILSSLYTLRIVLGGAAIDANITYWLLAFSLFLFFSLALVKRYSELLFVSSNINELSGDKSSYGRGYTFDDMPTILIIGISSGLLAVLVFALYINSPEITVLYQTPGILWFGLCILLFWISRLWLLVQRGVIKDDPVLFALKDKASLISVFSLFIIMWLAQLIN
jgi:4-hydroxybenzoate polyprenyltransferase